MQRADLGKSGTPLCVMKPRITANIVTCKTLANFQKQTWVNETKKTRTSIMAEQFVSGGGSVRIFSLLWFRQQNSVRRLKNFSGNAPADVLTSR